MRNKIICYIGLGSNLDNPKLQVTSALNELNQVKEIKLLKHSKLYQTKPVKYYAQADFINAVAKLSTTLDPHKLLDQLQEIETTHLRDRSAIRYGPRTLDLDLLLYGDEIISEERLKVPHPEIASREFVLKPLFEIEPSLIIPGLGKLSVLCSSH